MFDFFNNLALSIEEFMTTPVATAIGAVFLVVFSALILLLLRYYEQN